MDFYITDSISFKVSLFVAWYDIWVGVFIDMRKKIVYICLIPCLVLKIERYNKA